MVPSDTALFWSSMVTILKTIASLCPSPLHLSGEASFTWYLLHLKNGREQNRQYIYTWITGMMYITKIDTIQHINTMHTDIYIYTWRFHCSTFFWQPPGWIHFLPSLSVFWGSAHFLGVSMDMSTFWGSNPFYTFVSIKLLEKSTKLQ